MELDGKPRLERGVAGSGKTVVLSNWLAKTAGRWRDDSEARIRAVYANRSLHHLLRESIEASWPDIGARGEFPRRNASLGHVKDVLEGLLPSVYPAMHTFGFEYASWLRRGVTHIAHPAWPVPSHDFARRG